jgi:hypothetical protein
LIKKWCYAATLNNRGTLFLGQFQFYRRKYQA